MKIIKLQAENIKKLKAVEISPEGNVVVISGRNGQGKTSVLDSIYYALSGKLPEKPIREGEERADIILDMEKYIIRKTVTKKPDGDGYNSYLQIETQDGALLKSPQTMLNKLIGNLTFDPLEFSRLMPKTQRQMLLDLAKVDVDKLRMDKQRIFDERTIVGREGKTIKGHLDSFDAVKLDSFDGGEPVDVSSLSKDLQAMIGKKDKMKSMKDRLAQIAGLMEELTREADDLVVKYKDLGGDDVLSKADETIKSINEKIGNAGNINAMITQKKDYMRVKEQYDAKKSEYESLSARLAEIEQKVNTITADAKMPIPGLAFDDNGVIYNNIPFSQLSSAEQLKVSLAMAMAMNPEIRVIRITDGSLLDSGNLRIISEMANDKDYQVWIEKVDESGSVGIYIEDGAIVGKDQGELF